MTQTQKRYVGLDVHKHYVMVGAVNGQQKVVLPPRKVSLIELEGWAQKYLQPRDEVVLEATTNAWYVHDLIKPLVERVVVTHPPHIKLIAAAMVKTDKKDTMTLAKLLAANLVPAVWVPPVVVRELRALVAHRRRLIREQTRIKNWRKVCCIGNISRATKGQTLCRQPPTLVAPLRLEPLRKAQGSSEPVHARLLSPDGQGNR